MLTTIQLPQEVKEFLVESNLIEREDSDVAHNASMIAWIYAEQEVIVRKKSFNLNNLCQIHHLLMMSLNKRISGKLRECDVYVGKRHCKYLGRSVIEEQLQQVFDAMEVTIKNVHSFSESEREATTKECHVAFEHIHPFEDGNGRVGRILYNIHRLKLGLPIHIIHEGDEQMAYYKWF
ncbi:MAG: Fic family protein [Nitrosomonadaceae bacterium]